MADLRDLLREAADVEPGLPDVPAALRRGVAARRQRGAALVAGAAAVVAAVVLVTSVLLPGGAGRVAPEPAAPTAPTSGPGAQPLPGSPGPLARRAAYDLAGAGLVGRLTVPDRGWLLVARSDGWVALRRGEVRVVVQRWDAVVDPEADPAGPADTAPLPADLAAWLTAHTRLSVQRAGPVAGGWTALDLGVTDPLGTAPAECNTLPCVLLATGGGETAQLLARERARLLVPTRRTGGDAVVVLLAQPRARGDLDPSALALLDSLLPTLDPDGR